MKSTVRLRAWPRFLPLLLLIVLAGVLLWSRTPPIEEIPYSVFQEKVAAGEVESVRIGSTSIAGKLRKPLASGRTEFLTVRVDPAVAEQLRGHGVEITGVIDSNWVGEILSVLLPVVLIAGLWLFLFRRAGRATSGFMAIGKSKAKVYVEQQTRVSFADVAGVDEAVDELQEVVQFLKDPSTYGALGAHVPKGVLLVGPPGTGKTLLARAVAGEAGVPFFSINGSEFVELFVGVGAARVRDLFDQARAQAPCIVFIDEIDALGRARGIVSVGGSDEKEQTLNQLLAELDGFSPESGVILLAATNRPEILDPALLRAGRFDRQIAVDRPDRSGRVAILRVHVRRVKLDPTIDLEQIAAITPGFTGADLANLVNEAALVATRRRAATVAHPDFVEALERIIAGLAKKSRLLSPEQRRRVAFHEMGHALVAIALPGADPVQKVSILPRGVTALGYTIQQPAEDRYIVTRGELETRLTVMLGGRAAESIVFGETSSGAADDLARATALARDMVTRFGMDERIGPVVYEEPQPQFLAPQLPQTADMRRFSEATAREVELAIRKHLDAALGRACGILEANRAALDAGAALLIEHETLTREQLPAMSGGAAPPPHERTPAALAGSSR